MRVMTCFVALLVCVATAFGLQPAKPTLMVLAAISLRDAMTDVAKDFESSHDAKVEFVFNASGPLAAQIESGAPADVFISAADAQVDRLAAAKLVDPASRKLVANNTLVLIVPAKAESPPTGFADLGAATVKHLAIGEPKSVPAGTYAMETLKHLKLDTTVGEKLVFGANVRQVLDYVVRGEADAGIVYLTDAAEAGDAVRVVAQADPSWHRPINYPAVVVSASRQPQLAAEFIETLAGAAGRDALAKHGFALPTTQPTQ